MPIRVVVKLKRYWAFGSEFAQNRGTTGRIALFAATAAVTTTACEASPAGEPASPNQIEDSAGVVIVENAHPPSDSRLGWQVSPEPSLSIGTAEGTGDFQLHRVDDALKLNDGRIVVANGGSHELLVFDEAGNYLTAWGQRGEGPGDFGGSPGHDGLSAGLFRMDRWPGGFAGGVSRWTAGGTEAFRVLPGHPGTPWSQTQSGPRRSCTRLS